MFEYFAGETFLSERNISFSPKFVVNNDVELQCRNDFFCIYDAAVTGNIDFALQTLNSVQEIARVQELSVPGKLNHNAKLSKESGCNNNSNNNTNNDTNNIFSCRRENEPRNPGFSHQ